MDKPHYIDVFVGDKVKNLRISRGISQKDLGDIISKSFQQVQKYESGYNRISSSILWLIARYLGAPVNYFFDGIEEIDQKMTKLDSKGEEISYRFSGMRETTLMEESKDSYHLHNVTEYFLKIKNHKVRYGVLELLKVLSENNADKKD